MARKIERPMLLFVMLFAFACLLLGGGWRLVGHQQEDYLIPVRPYTAIRSALSNAQTTVQESLSVARRAVHEQRLRSAPAADRQVLKCTVPSDANGNVLAAGTYMRAVYQAFVLDDGFV